MYEACRSINNYMKEQNYGCIYSIFKQNDIEGIFVKQKNAENFKNGLEKINTGIKYRIEKQNVDDADPEFEEE